MARKYWNKSNTFRVLGKTAGTITLLGGYVHGKFWLFFSYLAWCYRGFTLVITFPFAIIGHKFFQSLLDLKVEGCCDKCRGASGFAPLYCVFLLLVFCPNTYLTSMISFSGVTAAIVDLLPSCVSSHHFLLGMAMTLFSLFLPSWLCLSSSATLKIVSIRRHQENLVPFGLNLTKQNPKK